MQTPDPSTLPGQIGKDPVGLGRRQPLVKMLNDYSPLDSPTVSTSQVHPENIGLFGIKVLDNAIYFTMFQLSVRWA